VIAQHALVYLRIIAHNECASAVVSILVDTQALQRQGAVLSLLERLWQQVLPYDSVAYTLV
jgi:hypothetical protein